jgi:hypothetical protein
MRSIFPRHVEISSTIRLQLARIVISGKEREDQRMVVEARGDAGSLPALQDFADAAFEILGATLA